MERLNINAVNTMQLNEFGEGKALVKNYTLCTSSKGTKYILGTLQAQKEIQFLVWSSVQQVYDMLAQHQESIEGTVIGVTFKLIEFSNQKTISIQSMVLLDDEPTDYMQIRYDRETYKTALLALVQQNMSSQGYMLLCNILEVDKQDGVWSRFIREFAAQKYHDNCPTGLLVHTYKMVYTFTVVRQLYPWVCSKQDETGRWELSQNDLDIMYMSIVLHDIGKVEEMHNGVYQPESIVTHRVLGLEYIQKHKQQIIAMYGQSAYYTLQSVIIGHHDEYGDKAKTLYAYLVFLLDMFDSNFTNIGQILESSIQSNSVGEYIRYNDHVLSLME